MTSLGDVQARADLVLARCGASRAITKGRYAPVTVTVGDAEQLASDVAALVAVAEAAERYVSTYLALDGPVARRDKVQRLADALAEFHGVRRLVNEEAQ